MALVQATVLPVQQNESVLDKILKGVQLANGIVGTVESVRTMGDKVATAKLGRTAAEDQLSGVVTADKLLNYDVSDQAKEGYTPIKRRLGLNSEDQKEVWVKKRPEEMSPLDAAKLKIDQEKLGIERQGLAAKLAELGQKNSPQGKLKELGVEGRNKISMVASGLQALDQMDKSMKAGQNPEYLNANTKAFGIGNLISDTDFSKAQRTLNEAVGRLESGGAINGQEMESFRAMDPRPGDSPDIRAQKLEGQKDFLMNKAAAFGLTEDEMKQAGMKTSYDKEIKKSAPVIKVGAKQAGEGGVQYEFLGGDRYDKNNWRKVK